MASTDQEHSASSTKLNGEKAVTDSGQDVNSAKATNVPRSTFFKQVAAKIDLDVPTVLMMLKGAIAPAIGLAAYVIGVLFLALTESDSYQSDRWAREYSTLGFLISIVSILSLPILPRAKFVQNITVTVLSTCFAAAISLLQIRCAVSARQSPFSSPGSNSTGSSGSTQSREYNAAASVTTCVFLFFNMYLANTVRAYRPQLLLTSIQYCIFTIVASTYASTFPTMGAGMNFVERQLKVFFTGQALATGVAFAILPVSSRMLSYKQMAGVLNLMKASLNIHTAYLHGITTHHAHETDTVDESGFPEVTKNNPHGYVSIEQAAESAKKLKLTLQQASQLFGQLKIEISFAKKEIGWGKLVPEDFSQIWSNLQSILLPMAGLSTFVDILQSVKHQKTEAENLISDEGMVEAIRRLEAEEWRELVVESREQFHKLKGALVDGISHITYVLELVRRPKAAKGDVENDAEQAPVPGDLKFAGYLRAQVEGFQQHRRGTVRRWCEKKGIDVPVKFWEEPSAHYVFEDSASFQETVRQKQNHQQLYLGLYLEYLLFSVAKAVLDMVVFADSKVIDGTMSKNRFIFPGWRRIRKLMQNSFVKRGAEQSLPDGEPTGIFIYVGDALSEKKDPEHLPPTNWYQRFTDRLRVIPAFLGSPESAFGFRAAVASITLAILAYIRQTTHFYVAQRGIWSVIMTAISMGPHVGIGVQGFIARIAGTIVATVVSIAIWYMGDHKPAAIIPLSYLYFAACLYFVFKKPKHMITAVISLVTCILIIGYELQDQKVGTKVLESSGQQYYHIYVLAPYRLATVLAGLGVAFFWTYFPYPITTHATLRKDLGNTLFLMANYYSCTHSTVGYKLRHGTYASLHDKSEPMRKLDKARGRVFDKVIVMMNRLREHSTFTKYEPTFGGRFPKETYDDLIAHMQSLFNYMALINYSSHAFSTEPGAEESQWLKDFRAVASSSRITSHELTSILCLVSASITNSQPLPPYVRVPQPIDIANQLGAIDPGILSVKHISEPCYTAFAVLEIASILIMLETHQVLRKVKELVGEVDFSIHVTGKEGHIGSTTSSLAKHAPDSAGPREGKGKPD